MRTRLLLAAAILCFTGLLARTQPAAPRNTSGDAVDRRNYQDLRWRPVGPTRGGRVTAVAGVRSQPCTFYMGASGGGVWKTTDCGSQWVPVTDGQIETGSIGSIDVSESNPEVVYVGTGSAAIRSNVIIGRGVYKSTDAGRTWRFIGLRDAGQIGSIRVHPTNPDVAWLAALGSPYGPSDERGIYKTTDGGKSWRKVLFVNNETGGRVVAVNLSNPDELYAGMYRAFRKGWDIISGGPASEGGIYKSTDGGEHWTHLTSGLPQNLIGKIDLDIARSNPRIVYAMVEAPGDEGGLYRSEDAGAAWKLVNNSQRLRARPFYFNYVDVNPKNADEVWVNELALHKSMDGGKTFTTVSAPHGDDHGIWFNPDNPDYAIQCNDGGATVTTDHGKSWSSILNQPTGELYMVTVDEQYPYRLYAPQQDNTTVIVPSVPPQSFGYDSPAQAFTQASGCETGGIAPTPDGRVVWGACKGEVERYNVATGQTQGRWIYPQNRYGHAPNDIKYRFPRQTVIYVSPHDPHTIYQASHVLHRSTDEGVTWQVISPDLTAHEKQYQVVPGSPITRDVTGEEVYSSIYAMDESPIERGVLWVGANDGPVHVSRDGGKTWNDVTPGDLPSGGRVQNIDASHIRKGSAYIAVYRYMREHDLKPYIYRTDDYGRTWLKLTDGTNGIPNDHPTRVVREDPEVPGLLYAGTEFGAFVSFDNGMRWQPLQQNLPATPVTDIRVHRGDLVISTMGRAFWIMDDISPLRQLARAAGHVTSTASEPTVTAQPVPPGRASRPPAAARASQPSPARALQPAASPVLDLSRPALLQPRSGIRYRAGGGRGGGSAAPVYPASSAAIDYILPVGFTGPVSIEITDSRGRVVRALSSGAPGGGRGRGAAAGEGDAPQDPDTPRGRGGAPVPLTTKPGHNRFSWDYRWTGNVAAAPGRYAVRFTAGDVTETRTLEFKADPRVMNDGVTNVDLVAQQDFLLKVRDTIADAIATRAKLSDAMGKAGIQPAPSPGVGESTTALVARLEQEGTPAARLQALWARLVTSPGVYEQGMLIDQLQNIMRAEGSADQKVGQESVRRLDDLVKELQTIEAELAKS